MAKAKVWGEKSTTVQDLINELNKIEDKSKSMVIYNRFTDVWDTEVTVAEGASSVTIE